MDDLPDGFPVINFFVRNFGFFKGLGIFILLLLIPLIIIYFLI